LFRQKFDSSDIQQRFVGCSVYTAWNTRMDGMSNILEQILNEAAVICFEGTASGFA
jgi:hypothetical protein